MSRAPAKFTQADIARLIKAARQAGAPYVDVFFPEAVTVRIPLTESTAEIPPLCEQPEVVL